MKTPILLLSVAAGAFCIGCATRPKGEIVVARSSGSLAEGRSSSTYSQDIVVSLQAPEAPSLRIRLITISSNGSVQLSIGEAQASVSASVGGFFACEEFGAHGLMLKEVDIEHGIVTLLRTWAE